MNEEHLTSQDSTLLDQVASWQKIDERTDRLTDWL